MNPLLALLPRSESRTSFPAMSLADYFEAFNNNPFSLHQTLRGDRETIEPNFRGVVAGALKSSGPVFAVERVRVSLFSEARFMWRELNEGRPGALFWTDELDVFARPWQNATTGDLLARAILDADLAGNHFAVIRGVRDGRRIRRLRPDWVTILIGVDVDADPDADPVADLDGEVIGYLYHPKGPAGNADPIVLDASEVAHFAPFPDPMAQYRGMSWLTPVLREIEADKQATQHKQKFFENGATPNMVVTLDIEDQEKFKDWVSVFNESHRGAANAYKTLFLTSGADPKVVGRDFQQLDFKVTQGAGETRIAAAGGVHPTVVGLSEGLQGASLNAGNFGQARRGMSDITLRNLWRNAAGSFATLVDAPSSAELWYDDRDIRFLQEDAADAAAIRKEDALTIESLVRAGFEPPSAQLAVTADDFSLLKHTGLVSVQLQPPGTTAPTPGAPDE